MTSGNFDGPDAPETGIGSGEVVRQSRGSEGAAEHVNERGAPMQELQKVEPYGGAMHDIERRAVQRDKGLGYFGRDYSFFGQRESGERSLLGHPDMERDMNMPGTKQSTEPFFGDFFVCIGRLSPQGLIGGFCAATNGKSYPYTGSGIGIPGLEGTIGWTNDADKSLSGESYYVSSDFVGASISTDSKGISIFFSSSPEPSFGVSHGWEGRTIPNRREAIDRGASQIEESFGRLVYDTELDITRAMSRGAL